MSPQKHRLLKKLLLVTMAGACLSPLKVWGDSASARSKTKKNKAQLFLFFPTPTHSSGSPKLFVVPLLGPEGVLLPGGKLLVWVGRNDGTPLPNATVTVSVPSEGNQLDQGGVRAGTVTLRTNADGIAEVFLTAPDNNYEPPNGPGGYG